MNKTPNAIAGILWLVFGIFLLTLIQDWITTLGGLISDDFFKVIYYVSATVMIILTLFFPGAMLIISAFKEQEA